MKDALEASKDDFDNWVDKWDKALQSDIFKDAPKPPSTSKHTSDDSFFGLQQSNQTDSIQSSDSEYWRAINAVADGGVDMQRIDEADAISVNLPNPIRKSTEGKDQDLEPNSLGLTFTEDDIKKLEEMKIKLHELQSKIAAMDEKDYSSQINAMISKIDELSDKMGRVKK
jgi:predicted transcriptional regulator